MHHCGDITSPYGQINSQRNTGLNLDVYIFNPVYLCFCQCCHRYLSVTLLSLFHSFGSMRPNIFLGVSDGSAQYKKWYYELIVDQALPFVTAEATHLRVGWANTSGYAPYPSGGEGWGGNGVGDDLYSYGFDGLHLWSGEHIWHVRISHNHNILHNAL